MTKCYGVLKEKLINYFNIILVFCDSNSICLNHEDRKYNELISLRDLLLIGLDTCGYCELSGHGHLNAFILMEQCNCMVKCIISNILH